jgi:hypothetical protein
MIPDQLETTNLTLRPFTEEDDGAVYSYWQSDSGWERFNASVLLLFTLNDAQLFVKDMVGRISRRSNLWIATQRLNQLVTERLMEIVDVSG